MRAAFVVAILACSACAPSQDDDRAGPTAAIMGGSIRINQGTHLFCGDGFVSSPETCDDGNTTSGDGCSSTCLVETGYVCTGSPSTCTRDFIFQFSDGTTANLPGLSHLQRPTFGALTLTPAIECIGTAGASSWACTGGTVTEQGSGTTYGAATPWTDHDASSAVSYNGSGFHKAATSSVGDIGSGDFAARAIFAVTNPGAEMSVINKHDGVNNGLIVEVSSTDQVKVFLGGSAVTSSANILDTTLGLEQAWADVFVTCRRNGGAGSLRVYLNGTAVSTSGSCTTGDPGASSTLGIGAYADGSTKFTGSIALAAIYTCPAANTSCLGVNAEADAQAISLHASINGGLPVGFGSPTLTYSISSIAQCDTTAANGNVSDFYVTPGWMCSGRRKAIGTAQFLSGVLVQPAATNLLLNSRAFDNASWTKHNVSVTANSTVDPLTGKTTCESIVSSAAAGSVSHDIERVGNFAAGHLGSAHIEAIAGTQNFAFIKNTVTGHVAWFDMTKCLAGTQPAAIDLSNVDIASCFPTSSTAAVIIVEDTDGGGGSDTWDFGWSNASGSTTFDDGVGLHTLGKFCRAQVEDGPPTTWIDTAGSTKARSATSLTAPSVGNYDDDVAVGDLIEVEYSTWPHKPTATETLFEVSDTSRTVEANVNVDTSRFIRTDGVPLGAGWSKSAGLLAGGSSGAGLGTDGLVHFTQARWKPDDVGFRVDGWGAVRDIAASTDFNASLIGLGNATDGTLGFNGILSLVRVSSPPAAVGKFGLSVGDSISVVAVAASTINVAPIDHPYPSLYANGASLSCTTSACMNTATASGGAIRNDGASGATAAQIHTQWTSARGSDTFAVVMREGGPNSVSTQTAGQIEADLDAISSQAHSDGDYAICVEWTPEGSSTGFTSAFETIRSAVNTHTAADTNCDCVVALDSTIGQVGTCAAATMDEIADLDLPKNLKAKLAYDEGFVSVCHHPDDPERDSFECTFRTERIAGLLKLGGFSGVCQTMQSTFDSGDGLHPNAAGHVAITNAIVSACGIFASH